MEWILIIAVVIIGLMAFGQKMAIENIEQRLEDLEEEKDVDHRPKSSA
ncbi:MAG: hypothetical protein WC217_01265 [Candidatus Paceibacterota bacterium]|jgi:hypothetical protein